VLGLLLVLYCSFAYVCVILALTIDYYNLVLDLPLLAYISLANFVDNVHVHRTARSANGALLPRPYQNSPHYGPKHHTVALHGIKQVVILLRDCFYFILVCLCIVPTLSAPSTALLG
jgi:hypothetical protein